MQKQTQIQNLKSSIQKKEKQIQLLQLIDKAILKFKERKNTRHEKMQMEDLEKDIMSS